MRRRNMEQVSGEGGWDALDLAGLFAIDDRLNLDGRPSLECSGEARVLDHAFDFHFQRRVHILFRADHIADL